MYIKRYTAAAVVLMGLVGWYVYSYITQDTMSIDFFGIPLPPLSVALWVVIPVFLLYIASVLHMSFYSLLGSFRLRKYEKDYEKMIDAIIDAYLGKKERHYNFKTDRYKLLGSLLENTKLSPTQERIPQTQNQKINNVLRAIEDVQRGDVVDLRPFNLLPTNELVLQNEKNKYKKGELKAEDILANASRYEEDFVKEVYADFVEKASLQDIEKYKQYLTKDSFYKILSRINADMFALDIPNETLVSLMNQLKLTRKDYVEISAALSKVGMIPEQRMKLFETLSDKNEEVMDAYLYTLFDLEMLNLAHDILQNTQPEEYQNFKAYYALKECGKNFSIELFI